MKRFDDWRFRLKEFVRSQSGRPFKFGVLDGAMFAAGAIEAMTGEDLAVGYRGYRTAAGGLKKCKAKGHETLVGPFEHLPEIAPMHALAGDLVVFDGEAGLCVGIVQGANVWGVNEDRGVVLLPKSEVIKAYKVGE